MTVTPIIKKHRKRIIVSLAILLTGLGVYLYTDDQSRVIIQGNACQQNLAAVDFAISRWALANESHFFTAPTEEQLRTYPPQGVTTMCPQGGSYTLGNLTMASTCYRHGIAEISDTKVFSKWLRDKLKNAGINHQILKTDTDHCLDSLRYLDGSIQRWLIDHRRMPKAPPTLAEVNLYIDNGPLLPCPAGGKFHYTDFTNSPRCTIVGHTLP
ncbi:MAG TPA: hypothetical protein VGH19_07495 [Verrucomicrobiae bacterium]